MQIAIIGAGNVGGTLGERFRAAGHQVRYGVRDAATHDGTTRMGVAEAVQGADVVLLAVPGAAVEATLATIGPCTGQVVVDATNPIGPGLTLLRPDGLSGGERVQHHLPTARVVKAFNTTGAENMANPRYGGTAVVMPIVGDVPEARATVATLAREIGFAPLELGGIARAGLLEAMAVAWIVASGTLQTREFGWGMLTER